MSALGQGRTKSDVCAMSAFLPILTTSRTPRDVSDGPKAAVSGRSKNPLLKASLFDHLVGAQ
jgi:hypothetical protein